MELLEGVSWYSKIKKYKSDREKIKPEEMSNFVGCFLTGTAAEITPVSQIDKFNFNVCELIKKFIRKLSKTCKKKGCSLIFFCFN